MLKKIIFFSLVIESIAHGMATPTHQGSFANRFKNLVINAGSNTKYHTACADFIAAIDNSGYVIRPASQDILQHLDLDPSQLTSSNKKKIVDILKKNNL